MARKTTTKTRSGSKKPVSRKASTAPKRARKPTSRTVLDRDPMRPSSAENQLNKDAPNFGSIPLKRMINAVNAKPGEQTDPMMPIPNTMVRIAFEQDDMDAMIDRLGDRLSIILADQNPQEGEEVVKGEFDAGSIHNYDLINHLYRIRKQKDRIGQLIDRLTL